MTPSSIPAAQQGEVALSLAELLKFEHRQGRLLPMLQRAAREAYLCREAARLGLTVTDDELQQAADQFRRGCGLLSADDMHAWLKRQGWTDDEFERVLTERLLLQKLPAHIKREGVPVRFQQRPADYDRLTIRLIQVAQEELVRELYTQMTEEGASFESFAQQYSEHPSREQGGLVGPLFRRQLSKPLQQALAQATLNQVVGPFVGAEGFSLVLVESSVPAELDQATANYIAQELFEEWLAQLWKQAPFSAPLLDFLQ